MSRFEQEVTQAIQDGQRFLAAQDDDVSAYKRFLHKLTHEQSDRPLIIWDETGLRSQTYSEPLPEESDLAQALQFVLGFKGRAVFLFDSTATDLSAVDGLTRRFAQLADKLTMNEGCLLLLLLATPLPHELAKFLRTFGDPPAASSKSEQSASAPRDSSAKTKRYSDLRNLKAFDTAAWQERLKSMTVEEVQDIVVSEAFKDSFDRVVELRQLLKKRFARKSETLDSLFACAVAQVPCVLMGPPGTAKGHMIRSMCEGLGLSGQAANEGHASRRYFEYQLTRFTTPEEIFGPIHVQKLIEEQSYRRVTEGYLPTAQVAFLDEIFKASSAILNTLLSLLNERVFYNEGRPEPVPLAQIFAASNEPPQDESLSALYDRFPLRINCPAVDDDHLSELMDRAWEDGFDRTFGGQQTGLPQIACANDLRLLNRVSKLMFGGRGSEAPGTLGGQGFKAEFLRCFRALRHEAGISDRSLTALYSYSRASALLSGKPSMNADELDVFRLVRWDPSGELDRFVGNLKRAYRA